MATGELSNSETARLAVRKALVEGGYVDCVVTLTGQLFANTQIPCALWFLSKNRGGGNDSARGKTKCCSSTGASSARSSPARANRSNSPPRKSSASPASIGSFEDDARAGCRPGFCAVATVEKIREFNYALTPGRYVGASEDGGEDESRLKNGFRS